MHPSVCVVIPVYNHETYLYRALSSVYWQLEEQDEIIVVNDGSPNFSKIRSIEPFKNRVMLLENDTNRGVSFSRNRAIKKSRADWIKFLDADDVLAPYALNAVKFGLPGQPGQVQVVTGGCSRIINNKYQDYLNGAAESLKSIRFYNPMLLSATFIKREALIAVNLFDEDISFEEDWDMWFRLQRMYGLHAFAVTDQPICYYWISDDERKVKVFNKLRKGIPVREYFRHEYGADPRE